MRIRNILLVSLFVSLYGCQPEAPAPKAATPAAAEQAAPPPQPAVIQNATPPMESAPAAVEPVPAEKAARTAPVEKAQAAEKKPSPPPVAAEKMAPVQAVEAEPAPVHVPAEVKPEAKPVVEVSEADAMQLAKKSNCLGCHAVDKKMVGPAFRDVAAKYRGDAGAAEAHLVNVIGKGGRGVWGVMAMPPSPQLSEADRKILAKFVLSLK